MTRIAADQLRYHDSADPHMRGRWLSDVVLGAQDGIVNTLGVLLGVASATADARIVLATGMAAAVAESISMAAVAYTSSVARGDQYRAERAREYRHLDAAPDVEREEVRKLFVAKGFEGELLDRAVQTVCANRDVWVAMMMSEEHGLAEIERNDSHRSAAVVGGASLIASTAPIFPFALVRGSMGIALALGIGVALLLALGALKARLTTGGAKRSALTLAAIGIGSALAAYAVGALVSLR